MLDLVIVGGIVVTPDGPTSLDIGVTGSTITTLSAPGELGAAPRVIDAAGRIVLPGGVDPHVHTIAPGGMPNILGRDVIGLAALYGGMTTYIDFIWPMADSPQQVLDETIAEWDGTAWTDYGFHLVLSDLSSDKHIDQIPSLIEQGFPSFKIFTTNITPTQFAGFRTSTGQLFEILTRTSQHGGIVDVHAEDDELVMHQYRKHFEAGKTDIIHMPNIHTSLSEDLSFRHVLRLAQQIEGASMYMHHVTAASGVDAVRMHRAAGHRVYAETLAVLTLATEKVYAEPDGHKYHIYPSLKTDEDVEAIWGGIADGTIQTFGTDGVCCLWEEKNSSRTVDGTFGGVTGVEPKMALLYTELVHRRQLGLKRLVEVTSENAARIFGLYPKKGAIRVGSDADFVILDPGDRRIIDAGALHEGDYTPWGGREVAAWPCATVLGGRVVVERDQLVDDRTLGRLQRRTLDPSIQPSVG
jgi:dihydropyrimidinase